MSSCFLIFIILFIRVIKVILKRCSWKRRDWKGFSVKVSVVYYLNFFGHRKFFGRSICTVLNFEGSIVKSCPCPFFSVYFFCIKMCFV